MRLTPSLLSLALATTVVVPVTVTAAAAPAAAATAACDLPLDPDRRSVYAFTSSGTTLGFGRVVVQATRDSYHRYCVRFQTGGNNVFAASGNSLYTRTGGQCVATGQAAGDSGYWTRGYDSEMRVADGTCVGLSYSIRSGGRWYSTIRILRWNEPG